MIFKKVKFFDGKNLKGWRLFIEQLCEDDPRGILLFVAEETPFDYTKIQPLLKKTRVIVWGGIFPEVIFEDSSYKKGVVGCSIQSSVSIEVISNLNNFNGVLSKKIISKNTETLFILNDGWSNNILFLIETLYEISGKEMTFIGGGAGSLKNMKRPSLFTNDDLFANGAIIAGIEGYMPVGVEHGWESIHGPVIANEVEKHILKSVNWESAYKYYKKVVEQDSGMKLRSDNFLQVSKCYPFGILKYDKEIILRAPIGVDSKNNILLGSEIPKNSMLMIMKGDHKKIISAAGSATEQAKEVFIAKKKRLPKKALIIDCITRALFLEKMFENELKIIKEKGDAGITLFGFLSLGEIASYGEKYIELYNKTVVVGMGE